MASFSGPDLLLAAFLTMPAGDQDEALLRINEARELRVAGDAGETEMMLRALRRVAEHVGETPSPGAYRAAYKELRTAGEELPELNRVVRHFGTWRLAREGLELSEVTTARRIDARFRSRRVGKVWRYTDGTLRDTLLACAEHYGGRAPMVSEFEWWRERELQLAKAQGNDALHLPSPPPYRRRWKTWEGALLHFGFTAAQIAGRLEQP
ncbi:MAG: hypothetical protein WKF94_04350 [Solirubrobacteraceae bacterium]